MATSVMVTDSDKDNDNNNDNDNDNDNDSDNNNDNDIDNDNSNHNHNDNDQLNFQTFSGSEGIQTLDLLCTNTLLHYSTNCATGPWEHYVSDYLYGTCYTCDIM